MEIRAFANQDTNTMERVNCVYLSVIHHAVKVIVLRRMYALVIVAMNQIEPVPAFRNVLMVVITVIVLRRKNVNVAKDIYSKMHNVHQFVQSMYNENKNEITNRITGFNCIFFSRSFFVLLLLSSGTEAVSMEHVQHQINVRVVKDGLLTKLAQDAMQNVIRHV